MKRFQKLAAQVMAGEVPGITQMEIVASTISCGGLTVPARDFDGRARLRELPGFPQANPGFVVLYAGTKEIARLPLDGLGQDLTDEVHPYLQP